MQRLAEYFVIVSHASPLCTMPGSKASSLEDTAFQTGIVDRYPRQDHTDFPLPPGVSLFCIPEGIRLLESPLLPRFHCFATTIGTGERLYGYCLEFYEVVSDEFFQEAMENASLFCSDSLNSNLEAGSISTLYQCTQNTNSKLYYPKSIVVLSKHMFLNQFKEFLTQLYRISLSPHSIPLERYIVNFMNEVPVPPKGVIQVQMSIANKNIIFSRPPPNNPIMFTNYPFINLFLALDSEIIVRTLECLLLEKNVLLLSNHYSLLAVACEALCSLMYPFEWNQIYIPLLPSSLLEFLSAPMPFLIGSISHFTKDFRIPDNVVVVNLDENSISAVSDTPMLPARERSKLLKQLEEMDTWKNNMNRQTDRIFENMDLAFTYAPSPDMVSTGERPSESRPLSEHSIRSAFMRVFLSIFKNYRDCLLFPTPENDNDSFFHRDKFLTNHPSGDSPFLALLIQTYHFDYFLIQRIFDSEEAEDVIFFDEAIVEKTNRSFFTRSRPTPFLSTPYGKIQETFQCPLPDDSDTFQRQYSCSERFPHLDESLCSEPRTVKQFVKEAIKLPQMQMMRSHRSTIDFLDSHSGDEERLMVSVWFGLFLQVISLVKDSDVLDHAISLFKSPSSDFLDSSFCRKLIESCGVCGVPQRSVEIVERMHEIGLFMDPSTYSILMKVYPYGFDINRNLHQQIFSQRHRSSTSYLLPIEFRESSSQRFSGSEPIPITRENVYRDLERLQKEFPDFSLSFVANCENCQSPSFSSRISSDSWKLKCSLCDQDMICSLKVFYPFLPDHPELCQLLDPSEFPKQMQSFLHKINGMDLHHMDFSRDSPTLFWNLVWHFTRMNLSLNFILLWMSRQDEVNHRKASSMALKFQNKVQFMRNILLENEK